MMIPNPTRTIVIKKDIETIKNKLSHIQDWSGKNVGINIVSSSLDDNLNTFNFSCQANIVGLIDLGNDGIVTLEEEGENATRLTIEMRKRLGCISDQFEAQDLNDQIQHFLSLLSSLLNKDENELANAPVQPKKKKHTLLWIIVGIALLSMFCAV